LIDDIKTFVLLKYEILTSDSNTWHLCDTYPEEVRTKWAWRCANDVEHLAKGNKRAEECIRISKLYRDGLATKEELNKAWDAAHATAAAANAMAVVRAADCAASAANAAYYAAAAAATAARKEKWNLYIEWLIEELCNYEKSKIGCVSYG